jgi:hypothetical protein
MPVSPELATGLAAGVVQHYTEAERVLLERIAKALAKGIDSPAWAEHKLLEVQLIQARAKVLLTQLEQAAGQSVAEAILTAWNRGSAVAATDLAGVLERALADVVDPLPGTRAVARLVEETTAKVVGTHPRILRSTMDVYREVVAKASAQVLLGTLTRRQAAQAALNDFAKRGVTGFVDTRGRGWDMASYVEMAVRSSTAHAAVAAHVDRLQAYGMDLVIVSDAPQECPLCRPWEGQVLSLSGGTIGTIDGSGGVRVAGTLPEATAAGLFHPGCRHSVGAYQPGITKPMHDTADPAGDAARQKLRYLERQVRSWKRAQAVALDPAAERKAGAQVRAYQAKIRAHVASTPAKRQPARESITRAR